MKKIIITLLATLSITAINAQNVTQKENESDQFNKWSVEVAGGFNKPLNRFGTSTFGFITPYTVDFGVRYMFNNKFGLKADLGFNHFQEKKGTPNFSSQFYRLNIQAIFNLGRIMNFETWTNSIGLLAHTGIGLGIVENEVDNVGIGIVGLTAQVKISDRFVLTGDLSGMVTTKQLRTFDGVITNNGYGGILNGTVGLTYYIGKNAKHADWYVSNPVSKLEKRVSELEAMNVDTDKDGVVDYLDLEPNSVEGAMVDVQGRNIDKNKNGIPDEVEKYLDAKYKSESGTGSIDDTVKSLINGGYVSVFFDTNKSTSNIESSDATSFILTYLRNNPSANIDIIGHADEVGSEVSNNTLATARANAVRETLIKANIAESRLNVISEGEDNSFNEGAHNLARKVTFKVK
ncbi:OmpA family protein [Flavobacterium sp. 7A]|uniref:OmpA family protein n=1 Tax=Flavobacterium sp. 7A TaxID=2940571 RepID=UPI002227B747|nr:OmpA family protein [Flavobacterium sp. 7A]MCW2120758.1 OOP family OmpA-OmpF porin [Flavobacterium sp. 7A]